MDKKDSLEAGKKKLCTSIWGQCTQMMKNELEATTDCASMSVKEDPMALIKNIKGVTHNFRDQQCATGSLWHAHKQLFFCIQHEDKDTKDHFDHFKNNAEVMENDGSKLGLEDDLVQQDEVHKNSSKLTKC